MGEAGLIAARVVSYTALMLAAGIPLYLTCTGQHGAPERAARRTAGIAASVGLAASLWWVLESIAAMAAMPIAELDHEMVTTVLDATPLGSVLIIRTTALIAAIIALWRGRIVLAALAAAVALATAAWTGHAGASEAGLGTVHRAGDVIHLLAAAVWLSALYLFLAAAIGGGDRQQLVRRLSGFAASGSVIVLLLLATGLCNTLIIAGWPLDWGSDWLLLLGLKLALFVLMLALAASNRWRITPVLERDASASLRPLQISLALEAGAGLAIVALVGWLGTLTPN